jgi:hypothetical protein
MASPQLASPYQPILRCGSLAHDGQTSTGVNPDRSLVAGRETLVVEWRHRLGWADMG